MSHESSKREQHKAETKWIITAKPMEWKTLKIRERKNIMYICKERAIIYYILSG